MVGSLAFLNGRNPATPNSEPLMTYITSSGAHGAKKPHTHPARQNGCPMTLPTDSVPLPLCSSMICSEVASAESVWTVAVHTTSTKSMATISI